MEDEREPLEWYERTAEYRAGVADAERVAERARAATMVLFGVLLLIYGAIMFFAGRVSVERAPERLTVQGRMA